MPTMSLSQQRQQQQKEEGSKWALTGIAYPGKHDVMLGRGGESNYHAGNLTFRSFIQDHKIRYQKARKQEKPVIALEVVLAWRDLSPPGRFLARIDPSRADSLWEDVGDDQACKRAGRTLGEKCSGKAAAKHLQQQQAQAQAKAQEQAQSKTTPNEAEDSQKKKPSPAVSSADISSSLSSIMNNSVASLPSPSPAAATTRTGSPTLDAFTTSSSTAASGATSLHPKKARAAKRPQASLDFIASFAAKDRSNAQSLISPPPTKKRRSPVLASRDFIAAATTNLIDRASPLNVVTPDNPTNSTKVVLHDDQDYAIQREGERKRKVVSPPLPDIGSILNDRQRAKAYALRENIPTAEFLTRTVFWD